MGAKNYRDRVFSFSENRTQRRVSSGEPAQAIAVLEAMFRDTESELVIFSKNLPACIFDDWKIQRAANAFFENPGTTLKIIVQDLDGLTARPFGRILAASQKMFTPAEIRRATGTYAAIDPNFLL